MRSRRVRKVSTVLAECVSDDGIIPREAFFDTSPSKAPPAQEDCSQQELAGLLRQEASSLARGQLLLEQEEFLEAEAGGRHRKKYSMLVCMSCDVRFRDDISQARGSELVLCTDCLQTQMRTKVWKEVAKPRKHPASRLDSNNGSSPSRKPPPEHAPPPPPPEQITTPITRKRTRHKKPPASGPDTQGDYSVYIPAAPVESGHWQFAHVASELAAAVSNRVHKQHNYGRPRRKPQQPLRLSILLDRCPQS